MQVDGVAHHLRDEEVVLELLDDDVEDHGREGGHRRDREADEDRRDGRDDRSDDREPLEHAGDQREHERELAEFPETDDGQDREADRGREEDRSRRGGAARAPIGRPTRPSRASMFSASARQPGGIAAATVRLNRSRSFRTKKSQTGMTTSPSRRWPPGRRR